LFFILWLVIEGAGRVTLLEAVIADPAHDEGFEVLAAKAKPAIPADAPKTDLRSIIIILCYKYNLYKIRYKYLFCIHMVRTQNNIN